MHSQRAGCSMSPKRRISKHCRGRGHISRFFRYRLFSEWCFPTLFRALQGSAGAMTNLGLHRVSKRRRNDLAPTSPGGDRKSPSNGAPMWLHGKNQAESAICRGLTILDSRWGFVHCTYIILYIYIWVSNYMGITDQHVVKPCQIVILHMVGAKFSMYLIHLSEVSKTKKIKKTCPPHSTAKAA